MLQKIKNLSNFLSLYLEGDAIAMYLELGKKSQCHIYIYYKKLAKGAFTDGLFSAFAAS